MNKSNTQKTFGTLKSKKILIVDDEEMNQLVIKNMIKRWGAESDAAEDGIKALQKINEVSYDIILMDLMMPGLDGYQTAEKIRKETNPPLNKIPILALTGSAANVLLDKITKAGINDFAAKPFKIEELHAKIYKLIFDKNDLPVNTEFENSKIINLDYLKETMNNNSTLIKEIINIFLSQTPEFLEQLENALNSENWLEVKAVAHKMKPTVAYVGISSIENIIGNIEDYTGEKVHLDKIYELVTELKSRCEKAFHELKKELEKFVQ